MIHFDRIDSVCFAAIKMITNAIIIILPAAFAYYL